MRASTAPTGVRPARSRRRSSPPRALVDGDDLEILEQIQTSPRFRPVLKSLTEMLQDYAIGYERLREASHRRVRDVWESPQVSKSYFDQNVAGAMLTHRMSSVLV